MPIPLAILATGLAAGALAEVSDKYLRSVGLDPLGRTDLYLPLTSELLTTVDLPGVLIPRSVRTRWHNDMARIQGVLSVGATDDPGLTDLADGDLGPLLGMEPNAFYAEKAARSSYADPALPWTPTAVDTELPSTVANAANILVRTFRDAHVEDWCGVLHEDGTDEFSLSEMRRSCLDLKAQGADAEVACGVCASFAEWMVFDPTPDVAANPGLAEPSICTVLAGQPGIEADSEAGDFDRAALARRWCETDSACAVGPPGPVTGDLDTPFVLAEAGGLIIQGNAVTLRAFDDGTDSASVSESGAGFSFSSSARASFGSLFASARLTVDDPEVHSGEATAVAESQHRIGAISGQDQCALQCTSEARLTATLRGEVGEDGFASYRLAFDPNDRFAGDAAVFTVRGPASIEETFVLETVFRHPTEATPIYVGTELQVTQDASITASLGIPSMTLIGCE